MNCDDIKYNDLEWCEGAVNLPGIYPVVYAIDKRSIVAWPTRGAATAENVGALVTYTGNFQLAVGAKFRKVGVIVDKSPITSASQGAKPSKSFLNTGTLVHQGVEEEATAFAQQANNDDLVYVFRAKNGKYRILGNEMFQTDTAIAQNLGGAATDEMGTTLTVTVTDLSPAPFYTGEITTADGIVNQAPVIGE
jgi:hypothetical protein